MSFDLRMLCIQSTVKLIYARHIFRFMGDIVITYDTLYDILRREKNTLEIQELEPNFIHDVLEYLREKNHLYESKANDHSLFGFGEKKQLLMQIENIQKILRELYAVREKKLLILARDVSVTNNQIVNKGLLLDYEKTLFDQILLNLNNYRMGVLGNLLDLKEPYVGNKSYDTEVLKRSILDDESNGDLPDYPTKALNTSENPAQLGKKLVFVSQVEAFIGPDMKVYGPFNEGVSQELPDDIANMMVRKGYANEI